MSDKPPNVIYLQWHGVDKRELLPGELECGPDSRVDVTWCGEQIFDSDVRYIRDKRYGKRSNDTFTANTHEPTEVVTATVDFRELAIQRVLATAAEWKASCCGDKIGQKFCESYGCASLDELLAPLREERPSR